MNTGVAESLSGYLKKYFGFDTFKGNQEDIIKSVLAGNDTFVLMLPEVGNHYVTSFLLS